HLHTQVLVVGGGPAGLAAATEAARAGARTVLLDGGTEPGGHLRSSVAQESHEGRTVPGHRIAVELARDADAAGVETLRRTTAFGVFDGGLVAAFDTERLYRIRADQTVFATGAYDQSAVFPNND